MFILLLKTLPLTPNKTPFSLYHSSTQIPIWVLFLSPKPQMGRRQNDLEPRRFGPFTFLWVGFFTCVLVYTLLSLFLHPSSSKFPSFGSLEVSGKGSEGGGCCRGIEHLELWGPAVKWGSEFRFNSSKECCLACKAMCSGNDGPCLCDSWVFCGNKEACKSKFGECWLKKQKDVLAPDRQDAGSRVMWTSGLIFGRGQGFIGLETEYGTLHIKLLPDCAPHSVDYILQLLTSRHCAGCQFYRAESRGQFWDANGNHVKDAPFGPPFALLQGTLEVEGTAFERIPKEDCPAIRRGSVAWVDAGPEFFISLADHQEWKRAYTVFGTVLPEDMEIAERFALLPTKSDVWNGINVSVLEKPVPLLVRRMDTWRP